MQFQKILLKIRYSYLGKYITTSFLEILKDFIIALVAVFIGALLAIQMTKTANNSAEKDNYVSLLKSSMKLDENYIEATNNLIHNVFNKPPNYFDTYRSIKYINQPFILMEIIKNGYMFKFSSEKFKNYLPLLISLMQSNDLTIDKRNINSYRLMYGYLKFKKSLLETEIEFIEHKLNKKQITFKYKNALDSLLIPLRNIKSPYNYKLKVLSDSIDVYNDILLDRLQDSLNVYQYNY